MGIIIKITKTKMQIAKLFVTLFAATSAVDLGVQLQGTPPCFLSKKRSDCIETRCKWDQGDKKRAGKGCIDTCTDFKFPACEREHGKDGCVFDKDKKICFK